jgi:AcrR family transcriptional regulator
MTTLLGLRQRKQSKTREALIRAAWELFGRQGYEATTVEQIAEAAEVSRRTYFRYFPTKEAVVYARREARLARFRRLLAGHSGPAQSVRSALLELAADSMRDRAELLEQHTLIRSAPGLLALDLQLDRDWALALAEALAGTPRPSAAQARRARILAGALLGAIRATLDEWFSGGCEQDLVELGREALETLKQGLESERAQE